MNRISSFFAGILALAILGRSGVARACAVCGAGDPTLTVMGDEKTFSGRLRVSADLKIGGALVGAPGDEYVVNEGRFELAVAYAPTTSTLLILTLPLLERFATFPDRARERFFTPDDVELRVKQGLWSGRRRGVEHRVALQGGLKAPSAPTETDDRGATLPSVLQPGMGSIVPFAGLFYGVGSAPWSVFSSVTVYMPYAVRDAAHASDSLRASASVQRQVGRVFAARIGVDTRLDASGEANGQPDPNSGGFVAYVSPAIVVSPVMDLVLSAGVHAPVVQAFQGYHRESTIGTLGVTYDW